LPLNFAVFTKTAWMLFTRRGRYDVLHTHEEGGLLAVLPGRRIPHVYDMGNEFSVVATNFGFARGHVVTRVAARVEKTVVRRSQVVIAHFPAIKRSVRAWGADVPVEVVPNIDLEPAPSPEAVRLWRERWCPPTATVAVYTGTLEVYQGVEDLVHAMATPELRALPLHLVVVGGREDQVRTLRRRALDMSLASVTFTGTVPQTEVCAALAAADIVVSPRSVGSNTPLKLFSYLRSGRPIVATRITSHTQILDDNCALLVEPGPEGLAGGLAELAKDPARRARLAAACRNVAHDYTPEAFVAAVGRAYAAIPPRRSGRHRVRVPDLRQVRVPNATSASRRLPGVANRLVTGARRGDER